MRTNDKARKAVGITYGFWTVLGVVEGRQDYCECECECGNKKHVHVYSLTSGKSKSCGCVSAKIARQTREKRNDKHT